VPSQSSLAYSYLARRRILNVSVIPYETHSPTKLLNYLSAPDCVIYTACIASAAVPGLLQPGVLMNKTASGKLVPWRFQGRHKDGSLRVDIPLQSLHLLFNSNFSIVSQVRCLSGDDLAEPIRAGQPSHLPLLVSVSSSFAATHAAQLPT
jgi:predicted acylesterase/phospholipase RssA